MSSYERVLRLLGSRPWLIEEARGVELLEGLRFRLENGAPVEPYLTDDEIATNALRAKVNFVPMPPRAGQAPGQVKRLAHVPLIGTIMPRGASLEQMSKGATVNLAEFQRDFTSAASDPSVGAILLEIDSPGGQTSLVPETADMIFNARRPGRPIVAVANTMAASAAYWIATAADQVIASPSATVGSIGVFVLHADQSEALKMAGVSPRFIFEGARKVEGNPFGPLDDVATKALQDRVLSAYKDFTADVARFRGVDVNTVRADPEAGGRSFGGGRAYDATQLAQMRLIGRGGMVDRVEPIGATVQRLLGVGRATATKKAKLAMI